MSHFNLEKLEFLLTNSIEDPNIPFFGPISKTYLLKLFTKSKTHRN